MKKTNKLLKVSINVMLIVLMLFTFVNTNIFASNKYTDTEHWAKNDINYVTDQGYFKGTSDTTFSPDGNMTRGMFVTVLSRYCNADLTQYNIEPFSDITQNDYYTKPILWAYANNFVSGTSSNTFDPNDYITREQAALIIYNYFATIHTIHICYYSFPTYNDMNNVDSWALDAVQNMKIYKVFVGDENGNFNPKNYITRAECSVIFSRLDDQNFDIYTPPTQTVNYLSGNASAYSFSLIGNLTSSGETLSSSAYTVAVPISQYKIYAGRHVEINYNGNTIVATCNDCGEFEKYNRVLDLSPGIIKEFGFSSSNSWGVRNISYRWID